MYYALLLKGIVQKTVQDPVLAGKALAVGECDEIKTLHNEDELAAFLAEVKAPVPEIDPLDELSEFFSGVTQRMQDAGVKILKQLRVDHQDISAQARAAFNRAQNAADEALKDVRDLVAKRKKQ